jgi:phosphatidylserine decarboxylase
VSLQYLLPQRGLTRLAYRLTRVRTPWVKDRLIRAFIAHFRVDLSEAVEPDPGRYRDFNEFFTRALRPEVRPWVSDERALGCPVDGAVSQVGTAADDELVQAKRRTFSLTALLGGDEERARPFRNGPFITLYLSPRDYHRIHIPIRGQLREMVHVPGRLFSVSPATTQTVPALFARNERVVTLFETTVGPMALVLVGAVNVASIETVWAGVITPPLGKSIHHWTYPAAGAGVVSLERGAELGRFNMGSTVILLFGRDAVRWDSELQAGMPVRMGRKLGEENR